MIINVDPNTDSGGFGYAAEGEYTLRVKACEQRQKTGSPFPYLAWQFEFTDPNIATVEGTGKVGNIFENTTLKSGDNAQFALKRVVDSLGLTWGEFDTETTIGMELQAKVVLAPDNKGELRNEVGKFIAKV